MRDIQLYAQILGILPPWTVEEVELNTRNPDVTVHLRHGKRSELLCPQCGVKMLPVPVVQVVAVLDRILRHVWGERAWIRGGASIESNRDRSRRPRGWC